MNSKNFIDTSIDDYYINPYKFKYIDKNKNFLFDNNSEKNLNLIIKTLTSIVIASNDKSTNDEINYQDIKKSLNLNLNHNNQFIIFKFVANNQLDELKKNLNENTKNVNIQDKDGDTPLHIAIFLSNSEACDILLKNGANLMIKDKWGQIPLHRICFTLKNKNTLKIINSLSNYLNKNIIFNSVDKYNNTPLHLVIKYIIKNNVIINKNILTIINKLIELTNIDLINDDGLSINELIKMLNLSK